MKTMKHIGLIALTIAIIVVASIGFTETMRLGSNLPPTFNQSSNVTKTAAYTLTTSDSKVNFTNSSANIVATLPSVESCMAGKICSFEITKTDATTYTVIVTPATGDTIGGESTRVLIGQNDKMIIHAGPGKNWTVDFESPYVVEDHEAGTLGIGTISYDASVVFEGATADDYETTVAVTDPTADITYQMPDAAAGTYYFMVSSLATNQVDKANSVWGASNGLVMEGATANDYETTVTLVDPTADRTITLPNATGTVMIEQTLPTEVTTGTDTLAATDCGKTLFLNSATEYVTTLPAPVAGCSFRVIVKAAPASASYTVVTASSANIIYGQIASAEDAAGSVSTTAASDTITFVDSKAIIGDYVYLISDGTNWYVSGMCNVQDGITTTQAT